MKSALIVTAFVAALAAIPASSDDSFDGRVTRVDDGDTLVVRDLRRRTYRVRIHAIDAPERYQAQASLSRQSLSSLTKHRNVTVVPMAIDPYGRIVAKVFLGDLDVGLEQIRRGMAWHYKNFEEEQLPEDRYEYDEAEDRARMEREGLWKYENPVAPWEYRRYTRRPAPGVQ